MYLQHIFFLIAVHQSDVFLPYLTWSNVFYFLCLSLSSPLVPLSWCLLSSAPPLVGQHAFSSISVLSSHITPSSSTPPISSTSINLSQQDRLPVSFLREMPFNEARDGDIYFPLLSSLSLPLWAFGGWRDRIIPLHLRGYQLPFIFFQFIHDPYSLDPPNIKAICSFSWEVPGYCPKTRNIKGFAQNLLKSPWDSFCSLKTLKV